MSELTLTVIKLGFLAVLWLFVLSTVSAIRADLFGARPSQPRDVRPPKPAKQPKPPRRAHGLVSRLVVVDGPDRGQEVALLGGPVVIGRGPQCTLPVSDEYVSTEHARLVPQDGRWYVEDLGSTNGTVLFGQRISGAVEVGAKTPIKLGKTVLELRK